ncbi:MAG: aminotransferase class V-fold PLP-dependent enzyme [Acidimicrobiales bacterium]
MEFPIDRVRDDTPGVANVAHFNNAGSSLPPSVVVEATVGHIHREAAIGGYEAAAEASERVDAVYTSLAKLIGASAREIAVVENATRAWDMAVYGFAFKPGDRVLTGRSEYSSNVIALLQLKATRGIEVVLIDDDEHGQIDLAGLETELAKGATMVSLTHIPTSGGLVNPAAEVGQLCRAHDVCFVLDACQSIGQMPLDVDTLCCDVLSATGRKYLRGPRGTGFLYVREEWISRITPPLLDNHAATWTGPDSFEIRADAKRFENWETNYAGKLGLGAAADYAMELGLAHTWPRVQQLAQEMRSRLAEINGLRVVDKGRVKSGIVTFYSEAEATGSLQKRLSEAGVNSSISTGAGSVFDLGARGITNVIRASAHYFNTRAEIDRLIEALNN